MKIRVGYELVYDCPQPTPMILMLNTHFSRASDILIPDHLVTTPAVPIIAYRDNFGNWCSRIVAPQGPDQAVGRRSRERHRQAGRGRAFGQAARGGASAGRDAGVSARQPLLRDRPPVRDRLAAVRQYAAGLGTRSGDLRLRAQPHHLRLRARARDQDRIRGVRTKARASAATMPISRSPSAAA